MMTSMRTIIDLPPADVDALDALCRREGISRAEAIRRAVAQHLLANRAGQADQAFGLWRARPVDGLRYQQRVRREWDGDK
jgi:metal-responsive CopG/Arc/MetJ family transcriptional regulator